MCMCTSFCFYWHKCNKKKYVCILECIHTAYCIKIFSLKLSLKILIYIICLWLWVGDFIVVRGHFVWFLLGDWRIVIHICTNRPIDNFMVVTKIYQWVYFHVLVNLFVSWECQILMFPCFCFISSLAFLILLCTSLTHVNCGLWC
jgi:hypothetical protein